MSTKKKITLILGIISLMITMNMVESTYAKYVSRTSATSKINIAKWDIVVNEEHLKDGKTTIANITPEFDSNENVADGVIAPGSTGHFDIKIDPSSTDVSFSYEIKVEAADDSNVKDLVLEKYYINDSTKIQTVADSENTITGNILYSATPTPTTVRVYVKWNDSDGQTMFNDEDTEAGHEAATTTDYVGEVKVSLKFTQIK